MPVVELDTIRASDALGSGSSPDGHTKNDLPHKSAAGRYCISVNVKKHDGSREAHRAAALHECAKSIRVHQKEKQVNAVSPFLFILLKQNSLKCVDGRVIMTLQFCKKQLYYERGKFWKK